MERLLRILNGNIDPIFDKEQFLFYSWGLHGDPKMIFARLLVFLYSGMQFGSHLEHLFACNEQFFAWGFSGGGFVWSCEEG